MKKISLIALSLLVISFIGYCKTNAQEKPNVTGASGVENPNPDQIPENRRPGPISPKPPKPVDPNAPKDYGIEDALRDIPYVTDDGKKRSIMAQRRIQAVKPLSDEIQFNVNLLLEQISYLREAAKEINKEGINPTADLVEGLTLNMLGVGVEAGINRIASGLRQYEEKLKELPDEIEWRDEFLEKTDKSRTIFTYILCKNDCSKLDSALRDVNSSPIDILDFMERELVPYVKKYPNTVLYRNFQQSLRDYNELIADSEITSKYPEVATRGFLDKLRDVGEDYGVEIAKASVDQAYFRTEGVAAGTKETLVFNGVELPFIWVPGKRVTMPKRSYYTGEDNRYTGEHRKEHIIVPEHSTDVNGFWILETPVTREMYNAILSYYVENKGEKSVRKIIENDKSLNEEIKRKVEEGELGEQALKYQLLDEDKVLASLNRGSANPLSMVISALNLKKENGVYGFEFRLPSDEEYFCIQHSVKYCEYYELCPIKSSDGKFYFWNHNPRYDEPHYINYHDSNSEVRWDMNKRPKMFRLVLRQISDDYSFDDVSSMETLEPDAASSAASLWKPSPSRKAGTRQTLKIGNGEYGFVWIPAGDFDMGSPKSEDGRRTDEVLHHVELTKGFWMLETEVPQSLYREVMGTNPSLFVGGDLPVERVSWDDAMEFCDELTTRLSGELEACLPTETQWEYSCRAGTKTTYWYGDSADSSKLNCEGNAGQTKPVKTYAPNPWGLYDMHGNVREWCLDYYGDYPSETVVDPKGPSTASDHVNRGGSWNYNARNSRSAFRNRDSSDRRYSNLGFRFVLHQISDDDSFDDVSSFEKEDDGIDFGF